MAIWKAQAYGLDEKLRYGRLGDIICNEENLSSEPARHVKLKGLLQPYELSTESGLQKVNPNQSPLAWIQNLYRCYQSAALRVYRAKEVRPLKRSASLASKERWSLGREAK
jgi:hypothetical protein